MIIEQRNDEVVFRVASNLSIDELQDMTDFFEFLEISKKSKATQKDVDKLVKTIKKGRWEKTKNEIGL